MPNRESCLKKEGPSIRTHMKNHKLNYGEHVVLRTLTASFCASLSLVYNHFDRTWLLWSQVTPYLFWNYSNWKLEKRCCTHIMAVKRWTENSWIFVESNLLHLPSFVFTNICMSFHNLLFKKCISRFYKILCFTLLFLCEFMFVIRPWWCYRTTTDMTLF